MTVGKRFEAIVAFVDPAGTRAKMLETDVFGDAHNSWDQREVLLRRDPKVNLSFSDLANPAAFIADNGRITIAQNQGSRWASCILAPATGAVFADAPAPPSGACLLDQAATHSTWVRLDLPDEDPELSTVWLAAMLGVSIRGRTVLPPRDADIQLSFHAGSAQDERIWSIHIRCSDTSKAWRIADQIEPPLGWTIDRTYGGLVETPVGTFFKVRSRCGLELVLFENMPEIDPPTVS
jgi:hypothetical protein